MTKKLKILFLCTGNSCRSQMAEGFARHLHPDFIEPYSAGVDPKGMNPRAIQAMQEAGVDISKGRSKHVDELAHVEFDYVFTVCGHANETCPIFPGNTRVRHVGFEDPPVLAQDAPTEEAAMVHYRRVRDEIRDWIKTLPQSLDTGSSTAAQVFLWTSPIPLITFALAQWYVSQYDGWGAWAAAPILLGPVLLSIVIGIWGVVLTIQAAKRDDKWGGLLVGTMVSGTLGLWFLLNLILMEILRSI